MSTEQPPSEKNEEKILIPDEFDKILPYEELEKLIQSFKFEEGERFNFNEQTHQFIFSQKDEGSPAKFHKSTELDGYDICIWESIKTKNNFFLGPMAIHELAEIYFKDYFKRKMNMGGSGIIAEQDSEAITRAHKVAKLYEEKMKLTVLTKNQLKEFELFFQSDYNLH